MNVQEKKEIRKLVKRAKKGEPEAFGLIYDYFLPGIYRFILLKVSSRADAEDLSQLVFIKAWGAIGRFKERDLMFSSWLYRIARNSVIDFYRTNKISVQLEENIAIEDFRVSIEEGISIAQDMREVVNSFKVLTEEQKDVIIFRFVEELSYKEIAGIMRKNQPALRILQHRAINKLRKILGDQKKGIFSQIL